MVVDYRGFGAELAGAFDNANRGAERYAVARSDTTCVSNSHYRGLHCRSTPGYFLEAHTRFFSLAIGYLNRITRLVRPQINN